MDILRITTAGSVDDGKSTLIGRLLYETKSITQDKMEAIEQASKRRGTEFTDLSLLTDGLIAEREQGITIDVAHIYFSTPNRKYIIADTPGHIEYTRNMITGASNAQVAIILIDARHGIVEQTHRHYYISQLLRIPEIIVCINKMDLVGYSETTYQEVKTAFEALVVKSHYAHQNITYIPCSALEGEQIATHSGKMNWYEGRTLLDHLEHIQWSEWETALPARFPVQFVIRPKTAEYPDFRGFAGKIQSGHFQQGDPIRVLPSGQEAVIESIYAFDQRKEKAKAGESVTMTLDRDIDISRGDMIVRVSEPLAGKKIIDAQVCWLDHQPLSVGKFYFVQHGPHRVKAKITQIHSTLNVADYQQQEGVSTLGLNEIGYLTIQTAQSLQADSFETNRANGRFILIDESSNSTVGVGFVQ